ncbi:MAG: SUMF1/EgtB/PvdO family nonheme iron enzyme [Steroidobacteraceae bacterium]
MSAVRIREPLGERRAALPLTFGAAPAAVLLPGLDGIALSIESRGRQWLARPASSASLTLNGQNWSADTVLDAGDVIGTGHAQLIVHPDAGLIEVAHLAGNATVAPLRRDALPGEEVLAGVREIFATGVPAGGVPAGNLPRRRPRPWLVAAAAALLLPAALMIALVPVPLRLHPAGTQVHGGSWLEWQVGERLFVLPGRRVLTFTHAGYREQRLTLQVSRALAGAAPLQVALGKLPGLLTVDTGGIAAQLLVDGRPAGELPGAVQIEAGPHELVVRAPRHVDYTAQLTIEGEGKPQQLAVQLQSATGWLVVDALPANARISVDGESFGQGPQRLELQAGLRQLHIAAPGRRAWSSPVAILAGQTLDLGRVDLSAPPAAPAVAAAQTDAQPPGPAAPVAPPPPPPAARLRSEVLGALILLPAGHYLQGSERREQGRRANETRREVTLGRAFYLAETEVTNAQFRAFRAGHVAGLALDKSLDLDPQAVTNVSWNDAVEFCNWLSLRENLPAAYERRDARWQFVMPLNQGYRLPTEAEWEYAARYVDGLRWQRYAWGDSLPPPPQAANLASTLPDYRDEHAVVAPVGSYARTPMGFHDMGGNVSEWVHDVYVSLPEGADVTDPQGASSDGPHAVRGASWRTATIAELRLAWRDRASAPNDHTGFRVARYAQELP